MRARTDLFARSIVVATIISMGVIGCSGSDSRGYHPIQKVGNRDATSGTPKEVVGESHPQSSAPHRVSSVTPSTDEIAGDVLEVLPVSALAPVNVIDGADMAMLLKLAPSSPESKTAPGTNSKGTTSVSDASPRVAEVLIPEKTFQTDAQSKALRVSYDDLDLLKVLNLEPVTENAVELMPAWLKNLNGQRIKIRGFMYPTFEAEGIERFVLARDNQICCFGRDPKVYDLVQVDMKRGKVTSYIPATRSFDVVGRFKIEMISEDGKPYGLYFIEDAQVVDR